MTLKRESQRFAGVAIDGVNLFALGISLQHPTADDGADRGKSHPVEIVFHHDLFRLGALSTGRAMAAGGARDWWNSPSRSGASGDVGAVV